MSDTFCTYGEPGSFYGGDDYGVCGLANRRSCQPADSPVTEGDPQQSVPVASGPADRDPLFDPCPPGQEC